MILVVLFDHGFSCTNKEDPGTKAKAASPVHYWIHTLYHALVPVDPLAIPPNHPATPARSYLLLLESRLSRPWLCLWSSGSGSGGP